VSNLLHSMGPPSKKEEAKSLIVALARAVETDNFIQAIFTCNYLVSVLLQMVFKAEESPIITPGEEN
jgi:hypothetical protein